MNNTIKEEEDLSNNYLLFLSFIMICFLAAFIYNSFIVFKKFHNNMQPNHIYIMNLGITFIFKTSYMFIMYIHVMVSSSDFCFYYFIGIIIFISNNLDIIIMQVDRFAAIFWSLFYPGLATNRRAVLICSMTKVCALVTAVLVLILDRDYLTCIKIIPLQLTRTTNMILISGSQLCSAIVVGIVSSYLGYSMVRINKTVAPAATVGIRLASTSPLEADKDEVTVHVRRINDEPNMFYPISVSDNKHHEEENISSEDSHAFKTDQEARESEESYLQKRTRLGLQCQTLV